MELVFHLGAHCTDEGRIIKALLKDRALLASRGTAVLLPQKFRPVIQHATRGQSGDLFGEVTAARLFADQLPEGEVTRAILSSEHLLATASEVIEGAALYPGAVGAVAALCESFAGDDCTFCLALRNPATLVPALMSLLPGQNYDEVMAGAHPLDLRWSETLVHLREAAPGARLVLWCNEDLPFVWPEVLRRLGGLPPEDPLAGENDLLATLISTEGLALLQERLARAGASGVAPVEMRRDIVAAVLAEHLRPGADEEDVPLPGWTQALVDRMTADYATDVADIAALPGVEFLMP